MSNTGIYNVGFVGTGYIADYHAQAIASLDRVRLVAVSDLSQARAAAFARRHNAEGVYDSVEQMLAAERLDGVHVLTPPDQHFTVGQLVLEAGVHLLLEKPMCSDAAGCDILLAKAERRSRRLGVNHSFLFHPAYEQLRGDVRQGAIGPIDHLAITWALELPQITAGPFDAWVLRHPTNIVFEIGSHCLSQVLDLLPAPDDIAVRMVDPVMLPNGVTFYRRWQVTGWCGRTAVDIHFALGPGYPERTVSVRGPLGRATADLERNTYVLQRAALHGADLGKYEATIGVAHLLQTQARRNLRNYAFSKLKLSRHGNAYATSIARSVKTFYAGLSGMMDARCSGQLGRQVIEQCARIASVAGISQAAAPRTLRAFKRAHAPADALVLGGTGFIGRELVRQLLKSGRRVRVLTRSQGGVPLDADEPNLEVITGDVRNQGDLDKAVRDVTAVFHLARAPGGSWANYYQQDVAGTRRLAETCMAAGVRRLVYTGSIAVYNLARRRAITEQTPFDRAILRQNKYARAKAQAEAVLLNMHRACALPVVIVRPGIVIGRGGSLYHGGVGTWNGPGCCTFWGDGRGPLPLVLVEDVAHGLIAAADTDGVEGQSFNLVDMPCMTPRDYVAEIERFAGVRIQTFGIAPWRAYTADVAKWLAKLALRMPERYVPRYRMWKARMPIARFDCSRARQMLGWYPVSDRDTLVARGIHVHLIESAAAAGLEPVSAQQDEERA